MNLDGFPITQDTALFLVSNVILLMSILIGGLTVMHLASHSRFVLACTTYLAVACLAAGWAVSTHEHGLVAQAQEHTADRFGQEHRLQLDGRDPVALKRGQWMPIQTTGETK